MKNENRKKLGDFVKRTNFKYHNVEYLFLLNNYALLGGAF